MSFILDALKKSETERQQHTAAEFAAVSSAPPSTRAPRWIWLLGALLLVNLAVLTVALLRDDDSASGTMRTAVEGTADAVPDPSSVAATTAPPRTPPAAEQTTVASNDGFAARLSEHAAPPRRRAEPATTPASIEAPRPERVTPRAATVAAADSAFEALPTLTEIRFNEGVNLPDMSLDIHVFASAPENRFVFIDMQKHQEGSVLDAGPRLIEITSNGVILDYRGTRFVLPRE